MCSVRVRESESVGSKGTRAESGDEYFSFSFLIHIPSLHLFLLFVFYYGGFGKGCFFLMFCLPSSNGIGAFDRLLSI